MITNHDKLAEIRVKHQNQRIALTSGTFDMFHIGHLNYLKAVKEYGDVVVVMLSSDARIQARKGPQRPIFPEGERLQILDALKVVDYTFLDPGINTTNPTEPAYIDILSQLQPDAYVTDGEDVRFSKIIDTSKYITLVRVEGGKFDSTTSIIEYISTLNSK